MYEVLTVQIVKEKAVQEVGKRAVMRLEQIRYQVFEEETRK
jgi:nitrogen regulatory protein PII-like uncharacterized protein